MNGPGYDEAGYDYDEPDYDPDPMDDYRYERDPTDDPEYARREHERYLRSLPPFRRMRARLSGLIWRYTWRWRIRWRSRKASDGPFSDEPPF